MKQLTTILLSVALAGACLQASEESAVGVYKSEVGIYVLTVTLLTNGNYLARWDADIGSNGTASGSWKRVGAEVHLTPRKEEGYPMTGYLRVLLLREFKGRKALLRKEDVQSEDSPWCYLYRQEKPNNSPEATPGKRPPSAPSPSSGAPQL
jgi:hypothetical protein